MLSILKKLPRSRQKLLVIATISFIFSACIAFSWLSRHVLSENARFESFTESIFEKEVSGNALNLHYSLADPEKQGIFRPRATLGTLSTDNTKSVAQAKQYEEKLKTFSTASFVAANTACGKIT